MGRLCQNEVMPMTIHLKPETEALIQEDLQRGPYRTIEEFVEQAVRMLHEEEELWASEKQMIHEKIERGIAQWERGEFFTEEELRVSLAKHKAAWIAARTPYLRIVRLPASLRSRLNAGRSGTCPTYCPPFF
jgi:putative addiction module CopG family antidote